MYVKFFFGLSAWCLRIVQAGRFLLVSYYFLMVLRTVLLPSAILLTSITTPR